MYQYLSNFQNKNIFLLLTMANFFVAKQKDNKESIY